MIFIGGGVVGAGLTVAMAVHRMRYALHHPEEVPGRITGRLRHELRLTDEQAGQVLTIITRSQLDVQALRRANQPRIEEIFKQVTTQIRAVLTPEQANQWDWMAAEFHADWMPPPPPPPDRWPPPGPGGGPPPDGGPPEAR